MVQGIAGWDGSRHREVAVDADGRLLGRTSAVSRTNFFSTSTALGASGAYTSAATDASQARRAVGVVFADQAGTVAIQQSFDNSSFHTVWSASVTASTAQGFDVVTYAPYVRGRYVNSTTTQGSFLFAGDLSSL